MSRFQSVQSFLKGAAPAAAFACALAAAAPGQAAEFFLQSATMDTSRTAVISGPGVNSNVYIGPLKFTAYEGTSAVGDSFEFLGFCVDIYHSIGLGTLNLKYDDNYDLETNSKYQTPTPFAPGATLLTGPQILQVGRLVNYAYSGAGYSTFLTGHGQVHSNVTFITETGKYGTKFAHQSFAIAAIPEPTTWALMIGGFGLAGAALRRRRGAIAAAA